MRRILALALLLAAFCTPVQAQSVGNANNFVVGAASSGGCCTLVAHTIASAAVATNSVTTPAINTIGSNLEIVSVAHYGISTPTITDSLSNTWTLIYDTNAASTDSVGIWYSFNPTTGSSQTFTTSNAGNYQVITVSAFSGAVSGYDSPNVNHNNSISAATLTTGSVTPSGSPALLVTGAEGHQFRPASINSSFTITDNATSSAGVHMAGGMAYLVESSASATNPTWNYVTANACIAVLASFK